MRAKKSLGQHWLEDPASLKAICQAANVGVGDIVLEVGPGRGSLSASLLEQGAKVIAVELDERLAQDLRQRFKTKSFTLNLLSILDFDFGALPPNYKIVANIPYYLTNHLLRRLTEIPNRPQLAALLVQKEVAERVSAKPGEMSILAVAVQFYYEAQRSLVIPAKLFKPPPKVDSQILQLKRREAPLFNVDTNKFFQLVKAGFSARRKKLRSSLAGSLRINKTEAENLLRSAHIDPNLRAQSLSISEWYKLYCSYVKQS